MDKYKETLQKTAVGNYKKIDLMFFPELDWKSDVNEIKSVSSYFTKRGHRVFCFDIRDSNSNNIEDISDKLKIVNLNSNKPSYIDEIIKQNVIKDSILFTQDPLWFSLINYLKTKYNYKVIYNCLEKYLTHYNILNIIKASNIIITFSQVSLDKVKEKSNRVIMINSDDLPRYVRGIAELFHSSGV